MDTVFRIADITTNCSTRERGRQVYPALAGFSSAVVSTGEELGISFVDVDLVTPSFLDETVVKLLRQGSLRGVTLRHIAEFPVRSLERMLRSIGWSVHVQQEAEGVYHLAAA